MKKLYTKLNIDGKWYSYFDLIKIPKYKDKTFLEIYNEIYPYDILSYDNFGKTEYIRPGNAKYSIGMAHKQYPEHITVEEIEIDE